MVYVPLQALRWACVTRFLGSLGMALGASMILILPIAVLAMLAWTGFLGLTFVGRVPGGRPPAWDAGKAIPWPRPGDQVIADSNGDAIEGDATEVDAATHPAIRGRRRARPRSASARVAARPRPALA